jgi:hypothetical protein
LRQKGGVYVSFWTDNVFLTGLEIFVPEWPKGEFVSILIGYILLTKSLLCNVLLSQGCRIFQSLQIFRVYFSHVERAVL